MAFHPRRVRFVFRRAKIVTERPNTVAGLIAKRAELVKCRSLLEADIIAVTVAIGHLEAAIRILDP